ASRCREKPWISMWYANLSASRTEKIAPAEVPSNHPRESFGDRMTEVVVIGCGIVGLGFAVALASRGTRVTGVDTNARHVKELNAGCSGIGDAGLEDALRRALDGGKIVFATSVVPAARARVWVLA